jgi:hypothetical protein
MRNGSVMRSTRLRGPDVWEFRWRETGADGIFADADTVIILFDATAKEGIPYRNTDTWCFQMKEGKVIKAIAFFDTRDVRLRQQHSPGHVWRCRKKHYSGARLPKLGHLTVQDVSSQRA